MRCARCDTEGKKFTMMTSRKRGEFLEPVCPKCKTLQKYADAKPKEKK